MNELLKYYTTSGVHAMAQLTTRQRQVARLVRQGMTSGQIGHVLGISVRTVEMHRLAISKTKRTLPVTRAIKQVIRELAAVEKALAAVEVRGAR